MERNRQEKHTRNESLEKHSRRILKSRANLSVAAAIGGNSNPREF
jgi:hypothetical protein